MSDLDPQPDAYRGYEQQHSYTYEPGLIYLPVASDEPERPVRVRLHGGFGKRIIYWQATRLNAPPVIPAHVPDNDDDSDTTRPDDRVTDSLTTVYLPIPNGTTGNYTFVAKGTITMVQSHPDGPRVPGEDALPTGRRPFLLGRVDDAAGEVIGGFRPSTSSTVRPSQQLSTHLERNPELTDRVIAWPVTIYAPHFTTLSLFEE